MSTAGQQLLIADLMRESGVGFGTSGARGLAAAMTDRVCYAYTLGFLQHLEARGQAPAGGAVGLAGDYRPSSPRILAACVRAVLDSGRRPWYLGGIPTPGLVSFGLQRGIPTLMVTGSHIPADRNGIKFHSPSGEILKADEAAIRAQQVFVPAGAFGPDGALRNPAELPAPDPAALAAYVRRYLDFLPAGCLGGYRLGLYEHSSVAREALYAVLTGLGAAVERLGIADAFVPVDTEAIRPEDQALGAAWGATGRFDALVSADGDGDRPLVGDEQGVWLRGDIAGVLTARYLRAAAVVTPVSSNTALERSGWFPEVIRTRIGSPYVIAGMLQARTTPVVGYEANGGFLTGTPLVRDGRTLSPLPTRDALLVVLALLLLARERSCPLSGLSADLPRRFTASDRLKDFPADQAQVRIAAWSRDTGAIDRVFGPRLGPVATQDTTDGLRLSFANDEILHLRPSGNAPELRLYVEADEPGRAQELMRIGLAELETWRDLRGPSA